LATTEGLELAVAPGEAPGEVVAPGVALASAVALVAGRGELAAWVVSPGLGEAFLPVTPPGGWHATSSRTTRLDIVRRRTIRLAYPALRRRKRYNAPMIDLRSDTLTRPTAGMREAMARAEVGDDVYGEDPTVNALEARSAALLGKEAGLFVPTGAMGNLLAVLVHCRYGDEVLAGDKSHVFLNEGGAPSVLGGTTMRTVPNAPTGEIPLDALAGAIRSENIHFPRTGLICLENTHNYAGGLVLGADYMRRAAALGLPVHLDGARLFNAAVASSVSAASLAADASSVMVCFSKGLGAPVGSILAGSASFVAEARRWRKKLGGGMRQAGILAAAALYALDHHVDRLAEDHANARALAEGLASVPGVTLAQPAVQTNIVIVDVGRPAGPVVEALAAEGVRVVAVGPTLIRFVTHLDVAAAEIPEALARVSRALR
jgi:threonine aldolase